MSRCPIALAAVAWPRRPLALLTPGAERMGGRGRRLAPARPSRAGALLARPGALAVPAAFSRSAACPAHAPPVLGAAETPREHPELTPASPLRRVDSGRDGAKSWSEHPPLTARRSCAAKSVAPGASRLVVSPSLAGCSSRCTPTPSWNPRHVPTWAQALSAHPGGPFDGPLTQTGNWASSIPPP